jgi:type VI secretion system protein ImpH
MAIENWRQAAALSFTESVRQQPYRFHFSDVLRYLEACHPEKPRLGESLRLSDDIVYLRQFASLAFAPCELERFVTGGQNTPYEMVTYSYGLFGPNGPLPVHLTEYSIERRNHFRDTTFSAFADIFHHRLMSLFYRANANADPAVCMDRPQSNAFDQYVGALAGIYLEPDRYGDSDTYLRLYHAGLFAHARRSGDGLAALVSSAFRIPFEVQQFTAAWLLLRRSDQTALGVFGQSNQLGVSSVLGQRVYDCQHKFTLFASLTTAASLHKLLPCSDGFGRLKRLVAEYTGPSFAWDLKVSLPGKAVPEWRLGNNQNSLLGWSLWLNKPKEEETVVIAIRVEDCIEP